MSVAILAQATEYLKYYLGNISLFSAGYDRRPFGVHGILYIALLFLAWLTFSTGDMVHSRSIAGKIKRTTRAILHGYAPSCCNDLTTMQIPSRIAPATRAAAISLDCHLAHDGLTKEANHFARLATLHAKHNGLISDDEAKAATAAHRTAGRLKHNVSKVSRWADDDNDD